MAAEYHVQIVRRLVSLGHLEIIGDSDMIKGHNQITLVLFFENCRVLLQRFIEIDELQFRDVDLGFELIKPFPFSKPKEADLETLKILNVICFDSAKWPVFFIRLDNVGKNPRTIRPLKKLRSMINTTIKLMVTDARNINIQLVEGHDHLLAIEMRTQYRRKK